ncbi:hypothetical protein HID58_070418, partial [Brassica napus]
RHSIEECLFQLRKSTEFAGFEGGQSALTRAAYCEEVFSSGRRILWIMGILLRIVIPRHRHVLASAMVVLFLAS